MSFVDREQEGFQMILTECLTLLFPLAERGGAAGSEDRSTCAAWGYRLADRIPDGQLPLGQIDDLSILRAAYLPWRCIS